MWKNKLLNPCLKMNSLFGFNTNFISTLMMNSLICIGGGGTKIAHVLEVDTGSKT